MFGRDDDDRRVLVEQRDRAVLHLAGRVGLGRDVRDLLQLQRALERDRAGRCGGRGRGRTACRSSARAISSIGWSPSRNCGDLVRQLVDLVEDERDLVRRQRLAHLRQLQRDEVEQRDLRRERLRGGDADLEARSACRATESTSRVICEPIMFVIATVRAPLSRGELHRLDRVARLARLRDADHERVLVDHRVAVDPLGGDVRLDRDARPLLDHVAADDAGVVRGAAGEDDDPAQLASSSSDRPSPSSTSVPWRTRSPIVSATASGCS